MCRKKLENMSRNEQENNVIKQTDNIYARKYKKFKHKWVVLGSPGCTLRPHDDSYSTFLVPTKFHIFRIQN